MAFDRAGMRLMLSTGDGGSFFRYITTDTKETVETSGYFNGATDLLKLNDVLFIQTSDAAFLTFVDTRDNPTDVIAIEVTNEITGS